MHPQTGAVITAINEENRNKITFLSNEITLEHLLIALPKRVRVHIQHRQKHLHLVEWDGDEVRNSALYNLTLPLKMNMEQNENLRHFLYQILVNNS